MLGTRPDVYFGILRRSGADGLPSFLSLSTILTTLLLRLF